MEIPLVEAQETTITPLPLQGKTYVITGATSGIGLEVARGLLALGADLIGVGRSPERCRATQRQLQAAFPAAQVQFLTADLSLQSQVRQLAGQVEQTLQAQGKTHLDGLVNNAGTFTYWMSLTAEGFETQWAVNYLSVFLLTHLLLPWLQAAPSARVVSVSSASHYQGRMHWQDIQLRRRYNGLRAYEQSKLAEVLFTAQLNRRLGPSSSVRVLAADPGLVKTDIGIKGNPGLVGWVWKLRASGGIPAEESARGIVTLLSEPNLQPFEAIYWKHGKAQPPSREAQDETSALRLWALSEQMCGLAHSEAKAVISAQLQTGSVQ